MLYINNIEYSIEKLTHLHLIKMECEQVDESLIAHRGKIEISQGEYLMNSNFVFVSNIYTVFV